MVGVHDNLRRQMNDGNTFVITQENNSFISIRLCYPNSNQEVEQFITFEVSMQLLDEALGYPDQWFRTPRIHNTSGIIHTLYRGKIVYHDGEEVLIENGVFI